MPHFDDNSLVPSVATGTGPQRAAAWSQLSTTVPFSQRERRALSSHIRDTIQSPGGRTSLRSAFLDDPNDEEGVRQAYEREGQSLDPSEIDAFIDALEDTKLEALRTARDNDITLSCRPIEQTAALPIRFINTKKQVTNLGDLQAYCLVSGTGQLAVPDEDEDVQLRLSEKLISLLDKEDETVKAHSRSLAQLHRRRMNPESNSNRNPIDINAIFTALCVEADGIYIFKPNVGEASSDVDNADDTDDEV